MKSFGKGPIAWMTQNSVASNLFMLALLIGGLITIKSVKQEVFPEFDLDMVVVAVPYPGSSPAEVEEGILLAIEEALRGIDGVKRVTSKAKEGVGSSTVELQLGADTQKLLADINNAIDQIASFPVDAERPTVQLVSRRKEVISLALYGNVDEKSLRAAAEEIRTDLQNYPQITQASIDGIRRPEISIEIDKETLRSHKLTLQNVADIVRQSALELPGGGIKTPEGEVLLRTNDRKKIGQDFEEIPILSIKDGTEKKLGSIAKVIDGFEESDQESWFNGERAAIVKVFRVGSQTPLEIAAIVKEYVQQAQTELPKGLTIQVWQDQSKIYAERIDLLLRNASLGLILVLFVLGLMLEIRLAFWVTMGIPISFLGSVLLMPFFGVSINMISLFGFIVSLGMVVDDAIIVGESIYYRRQRGEGIVKAAILGTKEVAVPVTFSIMTTIVAFSPLFFVPGVSGKFFRVIPAIVVSVLLISLLESLFILPSHLAHTKRATTTGFLGAINQVQIRFSAKLMWFIENVYGPFLLKCLRWKSLTLAVCAASFILAVGYWASGRVDFTFMPKVEFDRVTAKATLPYGVSLNETRDFMQRLVSASTEALAESGEPNAALGTYSQIGLDVRGSGPGAGQAGLLGGHACSVTVRLIDSGKRKLEVGKFAERWRELVGQPGSIENLDFKYSMGPGAGPDITLQLSHPNIEVLRDAGEELAQKLQEYAGVKDIVDGFSPGKKQLNFELTDAGRSAGLTSRDVGRALRNAYFGSQVLRQARGREEMRVYVRLPKDERNSIHSLSDFVLPLPGGGEMPLKEAAKMTPGRSFVEIVRADGKRVIFVQANVNRATANARKVISELEATYFDQLRSRYRGLEISKEGSNRSESESLSSLGFGYIFALFGIFALLAIPFKSYLQPIVVMAAIPFGLVGALIGHILLGYDLSLISLMGIVALSGVVVNDSLVLVDAANRYRDEHGMTAEEAALAAGKRRFRPILLTSLTTFLGLAPMIFETSVQARFLIPMAISLGFGILFATFIILGMVPTLYVTMENVRAFYRKDSAPEEKEDLDDFLEDSSELAQEVGPI